MGGFTFGHNLICSKSSAKRRLYLNGGLGKKNQRADLIFKGQLFSEQASR